MKKVVISTWTGVLSLNYGSALQTVALQEMVKKLGYSQGEIIELIKKN